MRRRLGWCGITTLAWCACLITSGCGGETPREVDPPAPYAPPAEGAPECELSADCPAGTYCDLGECIQECNSIDPCTGELVCHPRGRCADSAEEPADPPVEARARAEVSAAEETVHVGATDSTVMLAYDAHPLDASVRYRVDSRVPWLRVSEARGSFEGALMVSLEIDRSRLEPGEHTGAVVLHTTEGDVTTTVVLDQALDGVYQGRLAYTSPRRLGSVPLRVELVQLAGTVKVRVHPDFSPTLGLASGIRATANARFSGTTLTGSIVQRFTPDELGAERALVAQDVGRILAFELSTTAGGGLSGTFTESWGGLLPTVVEVSGELTLSRIAGEVPGEFVVDLPPELPSNPSVNPPPLSSACSTAASTAAGASGGACTDGSTVGQLVACGDAILARGAKLEGATLITDSGGESGYDEMATVCSADLDAASRNTVTSATTVACVRPANLSCALALYGRAAQRGEPNGLAGIGAAASAFAGVGLLLLQDHLVNAFEAPYRVAAGVAETAILGELTSGRARAHDALSFLFQPYVLDSLGSTPGATAAAGDYLALRRTAQLLAQDLTALQERTRLEARRRSSDPEVLRAQLHADALRLLLGVVALSVVEQGQEAPPTPELGLFAEALTELGQRSLELSEPVDPLGVPPGFVEFLYDPLMAGPDRATNFQQVLYAHHPELSAAIVAEEEARTAVRQYDANLDALGAQLDGIDRQIASRLTQICGADPADPSEPDLAACGSSTGELAEARNVYEQEVQGIHIAASRIEGLEARVRIQRQRLVEVYSIRQETIAFVDDTGREINEIEIRQGEIQAVRDFLSVVSNSSLFNAGVPAVAAAASSALGLLQTELRDRQMRLQLLQSLQIMTADAQVEYINGMASIQEMLVGMAELNLELVLAGIRAATAAIRIATLEQMTVSAQAERELLIGRELSSLANDPSFRVMRDDRVRRATATREQALRGMYLAARAFEFETNTSFPAIQTDLVPALTADEIEAFRICLGTSFTDFRSAFGVAQAYTDEISVREDILGIRGPVEDPVTGEVVSEAEQFRRLLLSPSNIGPDGTVGLTFATTLNPGNGVFSTMVCNDHIRSLRVKLIGDSLGDDQARVYLWQGGTSLVRGCESFRDGRGDVIREYEIIPRRVEVQAGVNAYGMAAADAQLFGRSVAATEWRLAIPPGSVAPTNSDIDPLGIDDIVIQVEHSAISLSDSPVDYTPTCGG